MSWAVMPQMRAYPLVLVGPRRWVRPRGRGKYVRIEVLGELRIRIQCTWQRVHQGKDPRNLIQTALIGGALFRGDARNPAREVDQDVVHVEVEDLHAVGSSSLVSIMVSIHQVAASKSCGPGTHPPLISPILRTPP